MPDALYVHGVRFVSANSDARVSGLIGFVSFKLGKTLVIDGVALRQTADGEHSLSFPERRDRDGKPHPIVRPFDQAARDSIERQVFAALREMGVIR